MMRFHLNPTRPSSTHATPAVTWPASRFYWSLIIAPGRTRPGVLPSALRLQLEENVPGAESLRLHAVGMPVPGPNGGAERSGAALAGGGVLVCGVPRSELAAIEPGTQSLAPAEIPAEMSGMLGTEIELDPRQLNLLLGDFEPRASRYRRLCRHLRCMFLLFACVLFVSAGLHRRAEHENARTASLSAARNELGEMLGLPRESDLAALLQRQGSMLEVAAKAAPSRSATDALAMFIKAWPMPNESPGADHAVPRSLSVADTRINVALTLQGDPAKWLGSFQLPSDPAEAWSIAPARLSADGHSTHITLELNRPPQGQPGTGRTP